MKPGDRIACTLVWVRRAMAAAVLLALPLTLPLVSGQNDKGPERKKEDKKEAAKPVKKAPPATIIEAQFVDNSTMKLRLRDESVELNTPYGKLTIPVRDIERIELAFRIPDEVAKRIESAIADLGKDDFQRREAASEELLELGERAYPALLKAEKSTDAEVVRRVRELLEKVRAEVPEERLDFRTQDVIYTEGSKNTGRLTSATLKVQTFQFGEQQLKLADVRELRSPSAVEPEAANALPDPGNLSSLIGQVGKVYTYRITGAGQGGMPGVARGVPGMPGMMIAVQGFVWGSDTYTLDSSLALAAVHAGVLKPGQTGVVRVKTLGPQAAFQGSTRNGITSMAYGFYNGAFQFVRSRARPER